MRKKINICNKEYEINSSAYLMFLYKKTFGNGIMKDIQKLNEYGLKEQEIREKYKDLSKEEIDTKVSIELMSEIDEVYEIILKISYALIKNANFGFMTFDEWVQGMENIDLSGEWVSEVTELAVNSFLGSGTNG